MYMKDHVLCELAQEDTTTHNQNNIIKKPQWLRKFNMYLYLYMYMYSYMYMYLYLYMYSYMYMYTTVVLILNTLVLFSPHKSVLVLVMVLKN